MILAGDLGGTKANLGLFEIRAGKLASVAGKRYATEEHKGLEEVITDFLNETKGKVTAASFGIAGPVVQNRVHATNFPWIVDGASLAEHLGVSRVRLLNDLEAAAYGIGVMEPPDLEVMCTNFSIRRFGMISTCPESIRRPRSLSAAFRGNVPCVRRRWSCGWTSTDRKRGIWGCERWLAVGSSWRAGSP